MKQYMEVYDVELTTKGPVFIGSGQELKKTEYIFDRERKKVIIPNLWKMYMDLRSLGKHTAYENYMMNPGRLELGEWILKQRIPPQYIVDWTDYELDYGDVALDKNGRMQIMSFVKDAYGKPYIPGSSLKGMFRTILLAYDICENPNQYRQIQSEIEQNLDRRTSRNSYLQKETRRLEQECFHKLQRTKRKEDMVNDMMAGMIVSDSAPLSVDDLTLCQKVEYHVDGKEKRLNLLRECIRPDKKIHFTITVDRQVCKYTKEDIMNAVACFADNVYRYFIKKYPKTDMPKDNSVWLGGGAGFLSKTVTYPLFREDAVYITSKIFKNTNVPKEHKHNMDTRLGVSPHILKLTQYKGKYYQFGLCHVEFIFQPQ